MLIPVNYSDEEMILKLLDEHKNSLIERAYKVPTKEQKSAENMNAENITPKPKQAPTTMASLREVEGHSYVWGFFPLYFYIDHIYSDGNKVFFHAEIHKDSINELKRTILNAIPHVMKSYNDIGIYDPNEMCIKLYIQSGGGCIESSFSFVDFIRTCPIPIHTIGVGLVASAAVNMLIIGKKRVIMKNTHVLIHQFRTGFSGKRQDILDLMKHLEKLHTHIVNFISENTKLSKKEVEAIMERESWFTAEEVLKMGLVDEII